MQKQSEELREREMERESFWHFISYQNFSDIITLSYEINDIKSDDRV